MLNFEKIEKFDNTTEFLKSRRNSFHGNNDLNKREIRSLSPNDRYYLTSNSFGSNISPNNSKLNENIIFYYFFQ